MTETVAAAPEQMTFDYTTLKLSTGDEKFLIGIEARVKKSRASVATALIEMGRALSEAKDKIDHGKYEMWLTHCLEMNPERARECMRISDFFKSADSAVLGNIRKTSLIALSSDAVPETARQEALSRAESRALPVAEVSDIIKRYQGDEAGAVVEDVVKNAQDTEPDEPTSLGRTPEDDVARGVNQEAVEQGKKSKALASRIKSKAAAFQAEIENVLSDHAETDPSDMAVIGKSIISIQGDIDTLLDNIPEDAWAEMPKIEREKLLPVSGA